jgi:hypothetical protein
VCSCFEIILKLDIFSTFKKGWKEERYGSGIGIALPTSCYIVQNSNTRGKLQVTRRWPLGVL